MPIDGGTTDIGQRVVNWAVRVSIPLAIGAMGWLFGGVTGLQNRVTILETQGPYIQKQLDRIESKVDTVLEHQERRDKGK